MALSAARQTPSIDKGKKTAGQKGSTTCYQGGMACLDASGYCKPAVTGTGLIGVGRFKSNSGTDRWTNSSSDGASNVEYENGCFGWENSADADAITNAHKGKPCYMVDDQTVALTSNSGARSPAGRVRKVEDGKVYVDMSEAIARQIAEEILSGDDAYGTTGDITGFVAGSGTASKADSVWAGASGSTAYTVGDIVSALKALGILTA